MAQTQALTVAKWFISFAQEHGDLITNLKLQKLTYYAQAWYLAIHEEPLFDDRIEAWVHGPVIPNVYRKYSHYKWNPIAINSEQPNNLAKHVVEHLEETYTVFGVHDAYELERMTHQEAPWLNARSDLDIDEPCSVQITNNDMQSYYGQMLES